ncbi:MAG: peptidoglycan-binding protein [Dehalococcoidia bacterium]
MPQRTTLVKAKIKNLDTGRSIECLFNPTEYSFSKTNTWSEAPNRGANVPTLEFSGGNPIELTLQLFFDTHEAREDVRTRFTNALWELALVDPSKRDSRTQKGSPPICEFQWGAVWSFEAVVTNISQKFTMFLEDGTPTRATVDLTLRQAKDPSRYPFQNPTSGGAQGHRTHTVKQGETLDLIASQEYGRASDWRFIAEVNNIDDPFRLRPGTILSLPPLDHAR